MPDSPVSFPYTRYTSGEGSSLPRASRVSRSDSVGLLMVKHQCFADGISRSPIMDNDRMYSLAAVSLYEPSSVGPVKYGPASLPTPSCSPVAERLERYVASPLSCCVMIR